MPLRKAGKVELLKKIPLFAGCSKAELAHIAAEADEITVPKGTVLMREGQRGRQFFVIIEGTVRVTRNGRKLRDFGPGDHLGDVALVTRLPRIASGVTTSPARLLVLTDTRFRALIMETPSIAVKVLQSVGERIHDTSI
jgi:CRP-like cAMP-binding protein